MDSGSTAYRRCPRPPCCSARGSPGPSSPPEASLFARCRPGTFQYGANTTYVMRSLNIGVGVSSLPTTTRIESGTLPCSRTSSRICGMLTRMCGSPRSRGSQRHRSMFNSICRMRASTGTFSSATTRRPDDPVVGQPVPTLEPLDGVLQPRSYTSCAHREPGRAREIAGGREPERERADCRRRLARLQLERRHLRPPSLCGAVPDIPQAPCAAAVLLVAGRQFVQRLGDVGCPAALARADRSGRNCPAQSATRDRRAPGRRRRRRGPMRISDTGTSARRPSSLLALARSPFATGIPDPASFRRCSRTPTPYTSGSMPSRSASRRAAISASICFRGAPSLIQAAANPASHKMRGSAATGVCLPYRWLRRRVAY